MKGARRTGFYTPVHFINEGYPGYVVPPHLSIDRCCLTLRKGEAWIMKDGLLSRT